MLKIQTGIVQRAQRIVLYGGEGIGKTTLASKFPEPLFIDIESGSTHMDVRRLDGVDSWDALLATVKEVAATPDVCKTLVLDTADRAERMAMDKVCRDYRLKSIEAAGYGKGYTYLSDTFAELLKALDSVIAAGIHVVVIAHAKMRKFEQPDEMGAYDRWEMKLSRQVAPLLKEWCDMLLFLNYKTIVLTTENGSHKAQGGKRVMYANHRPTFDAKNRHGLPDEMDMTWDSIAPIFAEAPQAVRKVFQAPDNKLTPASPETLKTLRERLSAEGIKEDELQALVAIKGHFPKEKPIDEYPERFVQNWIFKNWENIRTTIYNDPEHTPF